MFPALGPTRLNPCVAHEGERPVTVPWVRANAAGVGDRAKPTTKTPESSQIHTKHAKIRIRKYTPKVGLPCPELSTHRGTHQIVTWLRALPTTGAPVSQWAPVCRRIPRHRSFALPRLHLIRASASRRRAGVRYAVGCATVRRSTPSSVNHTSRMVKVQHFHLFIHASLHNIQSPERSLVQRRLRVT